MIAKGVWIAGALVVVSLVGALKATGTASSSSPRAANGKIVFWSDRVATPSQAGAPLGSPPPPPPPPPRAIYTMNGDGTGAASITPYDNQAEPSWSPDGTRIALIAYGEVYVMNADGSGQRNLTRTPTTSDGWGATWARPKGN